MMIDIETQNVDEADMNTKGYQANYKLFKEALRKYGIIENLFLVLIKIGLTKKVSDIDAMERLGTYQYKKEIMRIPSLTMKRGLKNQAHNKQDKNGRRAKRTSKEVDDRGFVYTKLNSMFVGVRKLQ